MLMLNIEQSKSDDRILFPLNVRRTLVVVDSLAERGLHSDLVADFAPFRLAGVTNDGPCYGIAANTYGKLFVSHLCRMRQSQVMVRRLKHRQNSELCK